MSSEDSPKVARCFRDRIPLGLYLKVSQSLAAVTIHIFFGRSKARMLMLAPIVRRARMSELDAIHAIRLHPFVVPHQYPNLEIGQEFASIIEGTHAESPNVQLEVVELDAVVVGYIMHCHASTEERNVAQCGWSLHPDYWGRGIMTVALEHLLTVQFDQENHTHVFADCFSSNIRCVKLLERLRFQRWQYPFWDRLTRMLGQRSWKWERRYCLTAKHWKETRAAPNPM